MQYKPFQTRFGITVHASNFADYYFLLLNLVFRMRGKSYTSDNFRMLSQVLLESYIFVMEIVIKKLFFLYHQSK